VIRHNISVKPDRVAVIGEPKEISESAPSELDPVNNKNGDFYFNENNKELSYLSKSPYLIALNQIFYINRSIGNPV